MRCICLEPHNPGGRSRLPCAAPMSLGAAGEADRLRAVDRRHHRRLRDHHRRTFELQGGFDPRRAARPKAVRRESSQIAGRARRADRQRQQSPTSDDRNWLTLARRIQAILKETPAGRPVRDHVRHQHARGNGLFPEPHRESDNRRAGGCDAAGHRRFGAMAPQPAQRRPDRDLAGSQAKALIVA